MTLKKLTPVLGLIPLTFWVQPAHAMLTITLTATQDLNFGTITAGGGAGTVRIDVAGARTVTGGVTEITGGGFQAQSIIAITGSTGVPIDVSMGAASYTVNNGAGDTMAVNTFQIETNGGGTAQTITLGATSSTFPVGATLNVGAGQAAGTYTGTFTINANYQ